MRSESRASVSLSALGTEMPASPTVRNAVTSRRATPVPKEHGAWFMLGHCLLIGAFVGGSFHAPVILVILASLLTFMAMQGLKQMARAVRNRKHGVRVRIPVASAGFLAGAAAAGLGAVLGWGIEALWIWAAISVVITALYIGVLLLRKERSVTGEWLGIIGLTLSAGAVWTAGTDRWGMEGLILWALAMLYFGGTVPYVKLRVRQMKAGALRFVERMAQARSALAYSSLALAAVILAAEMGTVPRLVALPFGLSLAKVLWATSRGIGPSKIAHVGYSEAVFSSVFTVATIVAFWR